MIDWKFTFFKRRTNLKILKNVSYAVNILFSVISQDGQDYLGELFRGKIFKICMCVCFYFISSAYLNANPGIGRRTEFRAVDFHDYLEQNGYQLYWGNVLTIYILGLVFIPGPNYSARGDFEGNFNEGFVGSSRVQGTFHAQGPATRAAPTFANINRVISGTFLQKNLVVFFIQQLIF